MNTLRRIVSQQWGVLVVAALSIGLFSIPTLPSWAVWSIAIVAMAVIVANGVIEMRRVHKSRLRGIGESLKELLGEFQHRFVYSGSAYSIYYLIAELSNQQSDKQRELHAWANGCNRSRDFLERLLQNLSESVDSTFQSASARELSKCCENFFRTIRDYEKLVGDFYKYAKANDISNHLERAYNDFVAEYNDFVRGLRDLITEANRELNLGFDSKRIEFAKEIRKARYG